MKAIETKYIGPSNTRGARIKASAEGVKPVTISYYSTTTGEQAHDRAALALANKYGWLSGKHRVLARGGRADGKGNVYVFVDKYAIVREPKFFSLAERQAKASVVGRSR